MRKLENSCLARWLLAGGMATCVVVSPAPADARDYSLFHPKPDAQLRELDPDRPDLTESAHTVDPGHLQIEMDSVLYRRERTEGVVTETWETAPALIKVGLTEKVDIQFLVEPLVIEHEKGASQPGAGRVGLRMKTNLYDGKSSALALVPFGEWDGRRADGGLAMPLSIDLPGDFKLGVQIEFDLLGSRQPNSTVVEFIESVTVNRTLIGPWGAFVEVATFEELSHHNVSLFTNGGMNWMLDSNVRLDAGTRFEAVGELHVREFFLGVAARR